MPTLNIIHLADRPQSADRRANLTKQLIEQQITDFRIWPGILDLSIPFRGISRAHKAIVLHAKENNLSHVCIIEDDVSFFGKGAFDFFIRNIPDEYDLYLGSLSNGRPDMYGIVKWFRGMSLYIVHERFYDTFLNVSEIRNIDEALSKKGIYKVCPQIVCFQIDGYSYHRKREMQYSKLVNNYNLYSCENT